MPLRIAPMQAKMLKRIGKSPQIFKDERQWHPAWNTT
jgi:hypothetical protein